jgi:hypothetical protein
MPDPQGNNEENRVTRRQRVLKQGKILLSNDKTVIDCTLRDLSETGAKLLCGDPGAIPNEFRLVLTADRSMRDVKVMWRRPDQVGVRFTSEPRRAPLLKW